MRIDGYFQAPESTPSAVNRAKSEALQQADASRTSSSRLGQTAETLFSEVPELKHSRIEELKQQVASGTYRLDAAQIAGAMLNSLSGR